MALPSRFWRSRPVTGARRKSRRTPALAPPESLECRLAFSAAAVAGYLIQDRAGSYQVPVSGTVTASLGAGSLPAGLSLSPSGLISGTPAAGMEGTYSLSIKVTSPTAAPYDQPMTLTVLPNKFVDPNPSPNNGFGFGLAALPNGNVVVTAPFDDAGGKDAGAVYLYDGATGALTSTLRGGSPGDQIGSKGVTVLSNGNFLISSPLWDNGPVMDAGAVTWVDGVAGLPGTVTSANSLVGDSTYDYVGDGSVIPLPLNGNYLVHSKRGSPGNWADLRGAVTWGDGKTGVRGPLTLANSLVGSTWNWGQPDPVSEATPNYNFVGSGGIIVLENGNYLVSTPGWDAVRWDAEQGVDAGAVTFGNGMTGVAGMISADNSLVGSMKNDQVGLRPGRYPISNSDASNRFDESGITELKNGNYVVVSPGVDSTSFTWNGTEWENEEDLGAATWGSGVVGVRGVVSEFNSLMGSAPHDRVGSYGATALDNGHYVVNSPDCDVIETYSQLRFSYVDAGAVTWGDGRRGTTGRVSLTNSLIGQGDSYSEDHVPKGSRVGSGGITPLTNGHYVVSSPEWVDSGSIWIGDEGRDGAVTWCNGTGPTDQSVSPLNSLVGKSMDRIANAWYLDGVDRKGKVVTPLPNGHYVVASPLWDGGRGAVTWCNGSTGRAGTITSSTSLVGVSTGDRIGSGGVTVLANGNYVVSSPDWTIGAMKSVGAFTWAPGSGGIVGLVSSANSLVGSSQWDSSLASVTPLQTGNYVVSRPSWSDGTVASVGAVTFGNGTTGIIGVVTAANSLIGGSAGDFVGRDVIPLVSGNYVVASPTWDRGSVTEAGAVTFGSGNTGVSGHVEVANSLVGSSVGDRVGDVVTQLANGNFVVGSPAWDNGAVSDAGAVTWGSGTNGVTGAVSVLNSLVGSTTTGFFGNLTTLRDGNYLVKGSVGGMPAIAWADGTRPTGGFLTGHNALVGPFNAAYPQGFVLNGTNAFVGVPKPSIIATLSMSGPSSTTTTVEASAGQSPLNTPVTFTATVLGCNAGSVTFMDGASEIATVTLSAGKATFTTSALAAGAHAIRAKFLGSTMHAPSLSPPITHTVTATARPTVTGHPANVAVNPGSAATFTATASGFPAPTIQWQRSTNGGVAWSNIPGATAASCTVANVQVGSHGHLYRAVFTNTLGSATTTPASLWVNRSPTITAQPGNVTAAPGATATFSASADGHPAPAVQWEKESGGAWAPIAGATSASYTTPVLGLADNGGRYRAVFTNSRGTAQSNPALLTVAPTATVTGVSVGWGSQTAALFDASGGRLLPAGRTTSIPWLGITTLRLSLDQPITSLAPGDITLSSLAGSGYTVASVSGSGTTWTVTLGSGGLTQADRVTVTVGGSNVATYTRRLDVLPGDVNDDGVVTSADRMLLQQQITLALVYQAIYDIDGNGVINLNDRTLVNSRLNSKLP